MILRSVHVWITKKMIYMCELLDRQRANREILLAKVLLTNRVPGIFFHRIFLSIIDQGAHQFMNGLLLFACVQTMSLQDTMSLWQTPDTDSTVITNCVNQLMALSPTDMKDMTPPVRMLHRIHPLRAQSLVHQKIYMCIRQTLHVNWNNHTEANLSL